MSCPSSDQESSRKRPCLLFCHGACGRRDNDVRVGNGSALDKLSKQKTKSSPHANVNELLMSKSTLSSVVSTLVRASVGASVSSTVPDEDLDKHVADLILREAKQKAESYSTLGIKAYLPAGYAVCSNRMLRERFYDDFTAQTQMHPVPTSVSFRPSSGAPMIITRLYCVHRRSQLKR